ncbi:hypothetical protein M8J75_000514, partial [Diaphorina citri]
LIAPPPPRKSLMTISSWSLPSATHNASRNLTLAAAGKMSKFDVLRSKRHWEVFFYAGLHVTNVNAPKSPQNRKTPLYSCTEYS